jgi:hypothetical protein
LGCCCLAERMWVFVATFSFMKVRSLQRRGALYGVSNSRLLLQEPWCCDEVCWLFCPSFRVLWCTQKWAKVWYPYILRSCRVHYRNISGKTEGSTWVPSC